MSPIVILKSRHAGLCSGKQFLCVIDCACSFAFKFQLNYYQNHVLPLNRTVMVAIRYLTFHSNVALALISADSSMLILLR